MITKSSVIKVNPETRKKIQLVKIKEGLKNVDEVVDHLIRKKKEDKKWKLYWQKKTAFKDVLLKGGF